MPEVSGSDTVFWLIRVKEPADNIQRLQNRHTGSQISGHCRTTANVIVIEKSPLLRDHAQMEHDEQQLALLTRMRELSAADLSILEAVVESLGTDESPRLTTIPGSANDRLWSEMTKLGWMSADAPLEDVPMATKVFVVHASAKEPLDALVTEVKRDALPKIFSELRREIPLKIAPPVIAAGGAPSDVALMLAGIVEGTMRRWIRLDLHDEFLEAIVKQVRMLANELKG
jgi:hypothetical protein